VSSFVLSSSSPAALYSVARARTYQKSLSLVLPVTRFLGVLIGSSPRITVGVAIDVCKGFKMIWNAHSLTSVYGEMVEEDYDDWSRFADDMKSHLRVEGNEPYIIAGTDDILRDGEISSPERESLLTQFDAITNWIPGSLLLEHQGDTVPWDEAMAHMERTYRNTRQFCTENGMDFVPMVFPGFDDRGNQCWGGDRHIPRSVDRFGEMLALADEYRTTDRIDIATWNDWAEGTQIEPGSFGGNDYVTNYLEEVVKFQVRG